MADVGQVSRHQSTNNLRGPDWGLFAIGGAPMGDSLSSFMAWVAPILSAIIVAAATANINTKISMSAKKQDEDRQTTEARRKAEADWRESVDRILEEQAAALRSVADDRVEWYSWRESLVESLDGRLDSHGDKIATILKVQCTQMRSDCVHRAHRYLDDLGCASTEEKNAFWAEYQEYCEMCEKYGVQNNFVGELAKRVMALPERTI